MLRSDTDIYQTDKWSPIRLGSSLELWLRADLGVTSDAAGVNKWADQSGGGLDVAQSTDAQKPTFTPNVINGAPALSFDATKSWLTSSPTALSSYMAAGAVTFFAVVKPTSMTGDSQILNGYSGQPFQLMKQSSKWALVNGTDTLVSTNNNVAQTSIILAWHDSGYIYLSVNKANADSMASGNTASLSNTLRIGAYNTNVQGFNGYIAEVGILNVALTASDRGRLYSYLAKRYGVA